MPKVIDHPEVVLVAPHVSRIVQHRDALPTKHLGLATMAARLEREGVGVFVVDGRGDCLDARQIISRIVEARPRIVGFTAMTHEVGRVAELARGVKESLPGIVTILGGPHASALPQETLLRHHGIDCVCVGEGEETLSELVSSSGQPACQGRITGLAFRSGEGSVSVNPRRDPSAGLATLPLPAWHLFRWTPYFPVLTARGCPHRCIFCARASGDRYRPRPLESVLEELDFLVRVHGAAFFCFEDECFSVDPDRTHRLLDEMLAKGLSRIPWSANLHAASVDRDLVDHMKKAGCVSVGVGVESGNDRILSRSGKGLTVEVAGSAVRTLKESGVFVRTFFILGHPRETWRTAMETIRFAVELNPDHASFGIMVPYPGTAVARLAAGGRAGYRLLSRDWADHDKYLGNALELDGLPRMSLELLQVLGYLLLYLENARVLDLAKFCFKHRRAALAFLWKMVVGSFSTLGRQLLRWTWRSPVPGR